MTHSPSPATEALHQPQMLSTLLANRLRARILSHDLHPAEMLNEAHLAAHYGVSRTPIREALKLLAHEGLLTIVPRRGMVVTVLSDEEVQEALQLRRALLAYAGRVRIDVRSRHRGSLLAQVLDLTERRLQLAFGPAFEAVMAGREHRTEINRALRATKTIVKAATSGSRMSARKRATGS
jgi:DNA-binding GntR family transcriptional regulator